MTELRGTAATQGVSFRGTRFSGKKERGRRQQKTPNGKEVSLGVSAFLCQRLRYKAVTKLVWREQRRRAYNLVVFAYPNVVHVEKYVIGL